jgi:putative (di)nucleoside polyphosphate hydrolase
LKNGEKKGTGQWQMPQGGLDEGEEPETAWQRELMEEIHVSAEDVNLLGSYPEWLAYELPKETRVKPEVQAKQGRGQVQKWFFVRLKDGTKMLLEPEKPEDQEFFDHKWMSLDALAEQTWEVRRPIYRKLATHINVLKQAGKER